MKHKHHKIPKHMGGTDDPSNLVEVSVEEHAELHFDLYLQYGLVEDWVAAQALSGQITSDEARRMATASHNTNRVWTEEMRRNAAKGSMGNSNAKGHIPSEENRQQWSEVRKGRMWWNNGKEETQNHNQPGEGWVKGRLKRINKWTKRDDKGRYV